MSITSTTCWRRAAAALAGVAVGCWTTLAVAGAPPNWGAVTVPPGAQISHAPLPTAGQPVGQWGLAGRAGSGGGGGPILATGYYTLTLDPTHLQGGGPLPSSAHAAELGTRLTHNGSQLSLRVDGSVTLTGSLNGVTVAASGQLPQGALSLQGAATGATGASGSFSLSNGAGKAVDGTFSLAAGAPLMTAQMASNGDPPGWSDRVMHWIFGDGGCGWFYKC